MPIPSPTLYPYEYDDDKNLFLVRDSLRVKLLEDYTPGDTSVLVEGDEYVMSRFPPSGIITLTEQCSEIDLRAVSLYYSSKTSVSFEGLELLPEFENFDSVKPKRITNVTMNVVSMHHNNLKDSLISVQSFLGSKYSKDIETMTGRIRYLESVMLRPKAWFLIKTTVGLHPLSVEFKNESFRLGPGRIKQIWDLGEGPTIEIETQTSDEYKSYQREENGVKIEGNLVKKTYHSPGLYTVKLTVENEWGTDYVEFENCITVKNEAPEVANIKINNRSTQLYYPPELDSPARIRSVANSFVDLEVEQGEDVDRPNFSYGGEPLDEGGTPIDSIKSYTWLLGDDLPHSNSLIARASYSNGGLYDLILRVDTELGSYRITKYENSIDIVESRNLWLFNFTAPPLNGGGSVVAHEFGLISETFKTLGNQSLNVQRSDGFLGFYSSEYSSYNSFTEERAKKEFRRNSTFVPMGTSSSGLRGNSMIFWASGGDAVDSQEISVRKYNAFEDSYETLSSISGRPWNWVALNSPEKSYFILGSIGYASPNQNSSFGYRTDYDLLTQSSSSLSPLAPSYFENGADELLDHPSYFEPEVGLATNGYFATYRSAWKDSSGYILRNSSVNEFFRISSFYRTNGSIASPFNTITKMPDMLGSAKVEGELVSMSNGIFFFNNSGEISAWNDTSLTWEVGRAGSSSLTFRSVQDTTVSNFDEKSNTLLAASDGDHVAYLSYDYSEKSFVKFNGVDLTFTTIRNRPSGVQFNMGVY